MRRASILALLLTASLASPLDAMAGKKKKGKKKQAETEQVEVVQAEAEQVEAPPEPVAIPLPDWAEQVPDQGAAVVLIEAGAEPRAPMRYSPEVGAVEKTHMTMEMDMEMSMPGMPMPQMDMPVMTFDMSLLVDDIDEDGTMAITTRIEDTSIIGGEPMLAAALEPVMTSLIGFEGTQTTTSLGETSDVSFVIPEGTAPEVSSQLKSLEQNTGNMSVLFPQEAVGEGAVWEVYQAVENNGMTVLQRSRVRHAGQADGLITLETEIDQAIDTSTLALDNLPPGASVFVRHFESAGSGSSVFQPGSVNNVKGSATVDLSMGMDISMEGQEMPMDMKVGVKVDFERLESEGD